jgi:hypothetical protein
MLDTMLAADLLDQADHSRDRGGRVLLQPERQCEVEHHLGVGRAFDFRVPPRADG